MGNYHHTSSSIDQVQNTAQMTSFQKFFDTFPEIFTYLGHFPVNMATFQLIYHAFPMSFKCHEHIVISEIFVE